MLDISGVNKISAKEAVREIMCGATRGLMEGYEARIYDLQLQLDSLKEKATEDKTYKERYEELMGVLTEMKKSQDEKPAKPTEEKKPSETPREVPDL